MRLSISPEKVEFSEEDSTFPPDTTPEVPERIPLSRRLFPSEPIVRRLNMKLRSELDYLWTGTEVSSRSYMTRNHVRMPKPNLDVQADLIQPPSFSDLYSRLSYVFDLLEK
uniref:Uncharacterized protein n=1 Tax=Cacopsylla melanoneura TaxID=428564 RepID=A0A8D8TCI8_9HEMI